MHDRDAFKTGMHAIGVAFNTPLTPAHLTVYWSALADLSDDEFQRAITNAIAELTRWPPPAELRRLAAPQDNLEAEAGRAFEAIEALGVWQPDGYVWNAERVGAELGPAAREGFLAVGGSAVWAERAHIYRRKDFVAAYVAARREALRESRRRLPLATADDTPRLPAADPAPARRARLEGPPA